jgi:hypothetical protein
MGSGISPSLWPPEESVNAKCKTKAFAAFFELQAFGKTTILRLLI